MILEHDAKSKRTSSTLKLYGHELVQQLARLYEPGAAL
jgi:hypothetical protein